MDCKRMDEIIRRMLEKLHSVNDGTVLTTWRLLKLADYGPEQFSFGDLLAIHTTLFEAAEEDHFVLDMSGHEGKSEGLPFNLEFVVRK